MRLVQNLDGIIGLRFEEKPEMLGAWRSARNVAWPEVEAGRPPEGERPAA